MTKTFFATYDLGISPANHDYLIFILTAEMERRRRCPDHRLHAIIVNGKDRPFKPKPYPYIEQDWRITHVCEPAAKMLGAGFTVTGDRELVRRMIEGHPGFPLGYSVDAPIADYRAARYLAAVKRGEDVPEFRPQPRAEQMITQAFPDPYITLTLRNSWNPGKNSNAEAWQRLALATHQRIPVVLVPDTTECLVQDGELPATIRTCRLASVDADIRVALYRRSTLNLGVSNGPISWAICCGSPFLKFMGGGSKAEWEDTAKQGWGPDMKRWPRQYGVFHWKADPYEVIAPALDECLTELGW